MIFPVWDDIELKLSPTELMQMLHRSRQQQTGKSNQKPFILIGSSREDIEKILGPLKDQVQLEEYEPRQSFNKNAHGDRWVVAMRELLDDLRRFLPEGVPTVLFDALPKHQGSVWEYSKELEKIKERHANSKSDPEVEKSELDEFRKKTSQAKN